MNPSEKLTKEYLVEHYVKLCKSERKIAEDLDIRSHNSVRYYLKKFGLARHSLRPGIARLSKEFLQANYVELGRGMKDIAAELGIAKKTVREALKHHDIPVRKTFVVNEARSRSWQARRKGCGDIPGRYWAVVKAGAASRELDFALTVADAWKLFEDQGGKCALSGRPLLFYRLGERPSTQTASLDRKDSSRGYVPGNVQWVHKDFQRMKWAFSEEQLLSMCREVVNHLGRRSS